MWCDAMLCLAHMCVFRARRFVAYVGMCHSANLQYGCHATQKLIWNSQRNSFAYIKRVTCRTNSANICSALFIQFFSVWTEDSTEKNIETKRFTMPKYEHCTRAVQKMLLFACFLCILLNENNSHKSICEWMNMLLAAQCSMLTLNFAWTASVINSLIIFPSKCPIRISLIIFFLLISSLTVSLAFHLNCLLRTKVHFD